MTTARGQLRRQRASYVALAIAVTIGGGASIGAAIAAHRTDRAYSEYVQRSDVAELVINPSLASVAMADAIKKFEGVEELHTSSLMLAGIGHIESGELGDLSTTDQWLQVLGSPDGRFTAVDRPAVSEGRLPTGDHEVFVPNDERAVLEASVGHSLSVGDSIELSFLWSGLLIEFDPSAVVTSIGIESLSISGFGVLPDEVLPEDLYPRQRLVVSGDVARKYNCVADYRADQTDEEASAQSFPPDCSTLYTYYSLQLADTPGAVASISDQFARASDRLSPDLPPFIGASRAGYYYISQERADIDNAVDRAVRPEVAALNVFALIALVATIAVFGIALARIFRRAENEFRTMQQLGATLSQRIVGSLVPALTAVAVGTVGAVAVGALLSPIGPVGSVRALVGSPGISLPGWTTAEFAGLLLIALATVSTATAFAVSRHKSTSVEFRPRRRSVFSGAIAGRSCPAMANGSNAALNVSRPGTAAAIAGCIVAVGCVCAALIFDDNVRTRVDDPVEYGWPWDVAMIVGSGYGDADPATIDASLADNPDVTSYELYGLDSSSRFGDRGVPTIYGYQGFAAPELAVVSGRIARDANEAVLGSNTARLLGVDIGDHIAVQSTAFSDREVVIVGTAVLPAVGSFVSDRAGLGDGAFVMLDEPAAPDRASFIGIHLGDGVDPQVFAEGLGDSLNAWSVNYEPPLTLTSPVRSAEIINVNELRSAPQLLVRLLGLALLGGFALSIVVSVRDRERELAILRVLGFRDAELRASVRWQAFMMMLVGVIVGIPLGIVAGRTAWRVFADQLGVVPRADVSAVLVAATLVGAMVLAMLAAIVPARSATRTTSGLVLRRS